MSSFEDSGLSLNDPNETPSVDSFDDSLISWNPSSRNGIQDVTIEQDTETSNGFNDSGSPNGNILISLDESTQNQLILIDKSSNLSSIQLDSTDRKLNSTKISSTTPAIVGEEKKNLMDDGVIISANSSGNGTLKLLNLSEIHSSCEVSQAPLKNYPISSANNSESIVSDEQKLSYKFDNNDSKEPVSSGSEFSANLLEIAFTKTPQTSSTDLEFPLLMGLENNIKAENSLKTPDPDSPEKDIKFSKEPDGSPAPLIDVLDVACPNLSSAGTVPTVGNLLDISTSQIATDKIKIDARILPAANLLQQQRLDYKSMNLLDLSLEQIETPVENCHQNSINPILAKEKSLNEVVKVDYMKDGDDENVQPEDKSNIVEKKDVVFNETSLIDLNNAFSDSLLEIPLPADDFGTFDHQPKDDKLDLQPNLDQSSIDRIENKPEMVDENHKSLEQLRTDTEESRSPLIQLDSNRIEENKSVKMSEKQEVLPVSSEKNASRKIPRLRPPSDLKTGCTNRFGFKKVPSTTKTKSSIPVTTLTAANGLEVGGIKRKMAKLNNGSRLPTLKRNI